jgi:hypothetical protein
MADADFTAKHELSSIDNHDTKLRLGRALFSDPRCERNGAIVVANTTDSCAGINAGDLMSIDFTPTNIYEGLYVVTLEDDWIGYKFFQRMPDLRMRDELGCYPVDKDTLSKLKVVGRVLDIYRSTNT